MKVISYIVRKISIYILLFLSHILFPHRVIGRKNIPKDEPFLLYANHLSMIDPVMLITIFRSKKMHFMGKEELFKRRGLSWYFKTMGGFPVKRGTADMIAIKQCVNYIKSGDVMVIFPEGTRTKGEYDKLQDFHNGSSLVLHYSKAKALPVFIENKKRMRLFSYSKIHIGKLVDLSEYNENKLTSENLNACTVRLKEEMEKIIENTKEL